MVDLSQVILAAFREGCREVFNDPAIVRVLRDAGLDEWLTLDEAAIIAKSTVRVLRDAGRRPDGLKLGSASGEPRVTRRHLDEWLSTEP